MNTAFILAAGKSERFGSDKLFAELGGMSVLAQTLQRFEASPHVDAILIAANTKNRARIEKLLRAMSCPKNRGVFIGGKTRYESVVKLVAVAPQSERFIIHNAANPFVTEAEIKSALQKCRGKFSGVAVGRPVVATLKVMRKDAVEKTLPRENLWEAETPQVVNAQAFAEACEKFPPSRFRFTDDLAVLEAAGKKTTMIPASLHNRKITTPDDLGIARTCLVSSVGIGEDSHAFGEKGREVLLLGGVRVKNTPALDADSDGDVVLHALCNALSSALGEGSLGTYATHMYEHGIRDSREYLKKVLANLARQHRAIAHCSISIEGSRPKIDPLAAKIKKSLASMLDLPAERIGITATSGKNLTSFGRGEALRCQAAVLLR